MHPLVHFFLFIVFFSPTPIAGGQKPIYERQLHLEDLLEVQHLQDPVSQTHSPGGKSLLQEKNSKAF